MDRIQKLCAYLDECESFADIGCDHGYCTLYMLKNGLCKSAQICDISEKCLQKAEKLLNDYVLSGAVTSACCNGLEKTDPQTEQILIAGMGGEELVTILKNAFIPRRFVFQPMRNVREVREYLINSGAEITVDEAFESGGKFYFVIKGKREGAPAKYSQAQLLFGKNLSGAATKAYLECELEKKRDYLARNLNAAAREKIEQEQKFILGVLNGEIK